MNPNEIQESIKSLYSSYKKVDRGIAYILGANKPKTINRLLDNIANIDSFLESAYQLYESICNLEKKLSGPGEIEHKFTIKSSIERAEQRRKDYIHLIEVLAKSDF